MLVARAASARRLGLRQEVPRGFAVAALLASLGVTVAPSAEAQTAPAPPPAAAPAPAAATAPAPPLPAPAAPTAAPPTAAPPAAPPPSAPPPQVSAPAPAAAAPAPASPAPAAPAPGPVAPVAAPTPAPVVAPAPLAPRVVLSPGEAIVHIAVSHRDAWLETRSLVDGGDFERTCAAPCDLKLRVDGREARVVAPGMTTSNVFRFDAGSGTAGVRVDGGSASARRAGIITLAAGIPVALAGMAMFALGRVNDESGLEAGGIAGLAVGGLSVGVSLPLLFMGSTTVRNAKGSAIALGGSTSRTF